MYVSRTSITPLTDGSGDATAYSEVINGGEILQIRYVPDGSNPLDTNGDIVITEEATGLPILTKANIGTSAFTVAPRGPVHSVGAGAALVYAGTDPVTDRLGVWRSRLKLVVAQGGAAKTGVFYIWVAGS